MGGSAGGRGEGGGGEEEVLGDAELALQALRNPNLHAIQWNIAHTTHLLHHDENCETLDHKAGRWLPSV